MGVCDDTLPYVSLGLQSTIRQSMEESLVQILSPKRRIDILRDVMLATERGDPYVVTFCGVNGVGKSTNLAKVCACVTCCVHVCRMLCPCMLHAVPMRVACCVHGLEDVKCTCNVNATCVTLLYLQIAHWLLQNGYRVLIAACDTFRSGAVEQLRTHTRRLSSLNPPQREGAPANVLLYDRGYDKDAAGVAMEAIHYGRGD